MDTPEYGETLKFVYITVPTDLIIPVYVSRSVSPYQLAGCVEVMTPACKAGGQGSTPPPAV